MADFGRREPVYYIGVAARLVGVHPQTLRAYERRGIIKPKRSAYGQRLYSEADLERVRHVRRLTEELGVNLAGVEVIFNLLDRIERMQAEIDRLRKQLEEGLPQLKPAPSERTASRSHSTRPGAKNRGEGH
ncbi:MAG: MerR family transcriptional regulator [Armatimonadetes bacterium]|nr:MerR family transcriptional regulator [Armatimonadota bacterium]